MAGKNLRKGCVQRALTKFKKKLSDPRFLAEIESIYDAQCSNDEQRNMIVRLMIGYGLTGTTYKFTKHYIFTREIDESLIPNSVGFINQASRELYWSSLADSSSAQADYTDFMSNWDAPIIALLITPETNSADIKSFLDVNWKLIQANLKKIDNRKIRQNRETETSQRNNELLKMYFVDHRSPEQIACKLSMEPFEVNQILSKSKKYTK